MPQESIPMLANPAANRCLAQVAPGLFTFDPLVSLRLPLPRNDEDSSGIRWEEEKLSKMNYTPASSPPS